MKPAEIPAPAETTLPAAAEPLEPAEAADPVHRVQARLSALARALALGDVQALVDHADALPQELRRATDELGPDDRDRLGPCAAQMALARHRLALAAAALDRQLEPLQAERRGMPAGPAATSVYGADGRVGLAGPGSSALTA